MKIADHLEKVERISALRGRLDDIADFEMWMWMSMTAGVNAMNAILHHHGFTEEGDYYAHQIPGLYVAPPSIDGQWKKVILPPGDMIHVDLSDLPGPVPNSLKRFLAALGVIEDMREPYVRGDDPITPALAARCQAAFVESMALAQELLEDAS